jgi:3-methyladenine DNA glycosylase AlkD
MSVPKILSQLESQGEESVRKLAVRSGAGKHQFGVQLGAIRALAKTLKTDHALALGLWQTGNVDARLLGILLMQPKRLAAAELDRMVRSLRCVQEAEWLISYVVKKHPDKETLRQQWMHDAHPMAARAGWALTAERVEKDPTGLDLGALLDRIEAELPDADPSAQWTMNWTLGTIGIHHPKHRKRAVAIGEKIGLYRDWPVAKGCTPPFVPVWVTEMVRRQDAAPKGG